MWYMMEMDDEEDMGHGRGGGEGSDHPDGLQQR